MGSHLPLPHPFPPLEGQRARDKRQQKHVTKVSPNTLSPSTEAVLLPGTRSGSSWAWEQKAAAHSGKERPSGRAGESGPRAGPQPRTGVRAPRTCGGAGASRDHRRKRGARSAACYLFLLLSEPRHLRGAQRRRGRGRGRGVGPGVGLGLHGGGAGTSAGRTSPKQMFMEAAWPAAAQHPRARPHALRAPR